jgi:hypothetical protein
MSVQPQLLPAAPVAVPVPVQRGRVLALPSTGAVGVTESGQAINKRGKKLGYLGQLEVVTPGGNLPAQDLLRRRAYVGDDDFARQQLPLELKPHLDSLDEKGQFPKGYFKGKTALEAKAIQDAVKDYLRSQGTTKI